MIAPDFDLEKVDLVFLEKSKAFLRNHVKKNRDQPFFLFHSAQAVHLPSFPADRFKGKSGSGPHGDFIFELDFVVGEIMDTLDEIGVADDTLVIFSSDNGPEVPTVLNMRKDHRHDGAHPWRGMKRDNWEGGHRVPFVARWPGKIMQGTSSNQTICLTDVMATCAAITDFSLDNNTAEDSENILPALLDANLSKPIREFTIHQTISLALAIRSGRWKYLDHTGSGGNRYDRGELKKYAIAPSENDAKLNSSGQLYDLEIDPGETRNLYQQKPEIVKRLKAKLEEFKSSGRSVPKR